MSNRHCCGAVGSRKCAFQRQVLKSASGQRRSKCKDSPKLFSGQFDTSPHRAETLPVPMPMGMVCQLRYDGGGSLLYQTLSGDSRQVPFSKASYGSPYLLVGQTVSFSLSQAGQIEAVDITGLSLQRSSAFVSQPPPLKQSVLAFADDQIHPTDAENGAKSPKPFTSADQSVFAHPSRKLQRNIKKFYNADAEERLQMIEAAEDLLNDLLQEDPLDGNQLCQLLSRCAAWLHSPMANPAFTKPTDDQQQQKVSSSALQFRIRRIVIRTLQHLDLADGLTYQMVEAAVTYICQLLEKAHFAPVNARADSGATRQWQQLQSLLDVVQTVHGAKFDEPPTGTAERLKRQLVKREEMAVSVEGDYHPSKKMKTLESAFHSEEVAQLRCSQCSATMTSSWYWRHPINGKVHVLVPAHGHSACRKRLGKRFGWRAQGIPMCVDNFLSLDFCHHQRQRQRCRDCGGKGICIHSRRKDTCKLCKNAAKASKQHD